MLPWNHKMMECFLDSGYRTSRHVDNDVIHVELSLEPTLDHLERAAQRSQVAAAASMKPFFEPRAVAVIGANRQRGKIGAEILHNLQALGFTGKVIPDAGGLCGRSVTLLGCRPRARFVARLGTDAVAWLRRSWDMVFPACWRERLWGDVKYQDISYA